MTGGGLSQEERTLCEKHKFPILYKPFLTEDVLRFLRGRLNAGALNNTGDVQTAETGTAMV
jgi:hypothetical protein